MRTGSNAVQFDRRIAGAGFQTITNTTGTKDQESSVAGDSRIDSNGMMEGRSKGATPDSLILRSHDSSGGDENSDGLGSSIIHCFAHGRYKKLNPIQVFRPTRRHRSWKRDAPFQHADGLIRISYSQKT